MKVGTVYTAKDACRLSGATYRQVDYWARTDVLRPTIDACGSGSSRGYTLVEVRTLWAIRTLADAGQSIQSLRKIAGPLSKHDPWVGFVAAVDGRAVLVADDFALVDLVRASGPVVVLDLSQCPIVEDESG